MIKMLFKFHSSIIVQICYEILDSGLFPDKEAVALPDTASSSERFIKGILHLEGHQKHRENQKTVISL